MKKLLLCPPTYYDIRYEINPWMNTKNPVDKNKALEQYETLKYAYDCLGVLYDEISPEEGLPDQVFTTDTGHVGKNLFIKAQFKYHQRRKEAEIIASFFKAKHHIIHEIPSDVFFEGGDFIKAQDNYFFGWGKRSSKTAVSHLNSFLDTEVVAIELIDDYFYHLDTCFAPINKDVALVNTKAFTKEGLSLIKKYFNHVIPTSEQDNTLFACNMVTIEGKAILTQGISDKLKDELRPYVDLISTIPMSEYIKGGGSIHCVSLEVFDE